jgi:hypothetical protein
MDDDGDVIVACLFEGIFKIARREEFLRSGQIDGYDSMSQELTGYVDGDEVGLVGSRVVASHHGDDKSARYGGATYALEHSFYGLVLAQTLLAGLLRGKAYLGIYESLLMQFAKQIIGAYIQRLAGVEQRACQVETRQVVVQVFAILGKRHEFAELLIAIGYAYSLHLGQSTRRMERHRAIQVQV